MHRQQFKTRDKPTWFCLTLCVFFWASSLLAADYSRLSPMEKVLTDKAMAKLGLKIDPTPQGKTWGKFHVFTEQPFNEVDGILQYLNNIHVTTRDATMIRQLLMSPGDLYNERLVAECEQELIDPRTRSLALVLPVQVVGAEQAGLVDLLVISRDVFSLRFNTDLQLSGSTINQLMIGLVNTNIAGANKLGGLTFKMRQYVFETQVNYYDPDLFSSGLELTFDQSVLIGRGTGLYEGVRGHFVLEYPLDSEATQWGYKLQLDHAYEPIVDYSGNQIRIYDAPNAPEAVERKYRWFSLNGRAIATRSYGLEYKNNLSFGYGFNWYRPSVFEDFNLTGDALQGFIDAVMPIREFQSFLYVGYNYFWNQYLAFYDYNTFALEEWVQLGPNVSVSAQFAARPWGSDYNFIRPLLSASYTLAPIKTILLNASLDGETRIQDGLMNSRVQATLTAVSPILFGFGRFVGGAVFSKWINDQNNRTFSLGGDNALRGTISGFYLGTNLLRTNLEFRTISWPLWLFRLGGVAFYDFGTAFNDGSDFLPTHSLGLGARILFLPFNRSVLRIDVGMPVSGPQSGIKNTLVTIGIGQAF